MSRANCACNVPNFDLSSSRTLCDKFNITAAILSHTAPGPEIEKNPVKAAALARQFNEFCAKTRDEQPKRYGFFASVPSLHDIQACLQEIAYAFDTLHADGIILFTSYTSLSSSSSSSSSSPSSAPDHTDAERRVSYLGAPAFAPIWTDLNRRHAVVLVHPTYTPNLVPANGGLPVTMLDFSHETARSALDLVVSGTLRERARECRIVLSHGGGTLASVVDRVAVLAGNGGRKSAEEIREEVGWFYFDTALCGEAQVDVVRKIARQGHILYGSDLPNAPVNAVERFGDGQEEIGKEAARVLFPRFFE